MTVTLDRGGSDVGDGPASTIGVAPFPREIARVRRICPQLVVEGLAWRGSAPTREHQCGATVPPALLSLEKQRRLCLTAEHAACATYRAARAVRGLDESQAAVASDGATTDPRGATRWKFTTTVPVSFDHGRGPARLPLLSRDRRAPQVALAVLMIMAFAAVVVSRLPGSGAGLVASLAPDRTAVVSTDAPSSSAPASRTPTAVPSVTAPPTEAPTPTTVAAEQTYTVRSGDTLSGIAARFGTTVAILSELNAIDDPSRIRVGQVLRLP